MKANQNSSDEKASEEIVGTETVKSESKTTTSEEN